MNVWEQLMRLAEAGPFEPQSSTTAPKSSTPSTASPAGRRERNVRLTDQELDAVIQVLENSKEKNIKGIDVDALEKKLYMIKVKKESMGSGNSTADGDSGSPEETEVEGTY